MEISYGKVTLCRGGEMPKLKGKRLFVLVYIIRFDRHEILF
jgi:hypothetical protein